MDRNRDSRDSRYRCLSVCFCVWIVCAWDRMQTSVPIMDLCILDIYIGPWYKQTPCSVLNAAE